MNSLEAQIRDNYKRDSLMLIRESGNVPAIVYGGKEENEKFPYQKNYLKVLIEKENFLSNIVLE